MDSKTLCYMLENMTPKELIELYIMEEIEKEMNKPLKIILSETMSSVAKIMENLGNEMSKFIEVKK